MPSRFLSILLASLPALPTALAPAQTAGSLAVRPTQLLPSITARPDSGPQIVYMTPQFAVLAENGYAAYSPNGGRSWINIPAGTQSAELGFAADQTRIAFSRTRGLVFASSSGSGVIVSEYPTPADVVANTPARFTAFNVVFLGSPNAAFELVDFAATDLAFYVSAAITEPGGTPQSSIVWKQFASSQFVRFTPDDGSHYRFTQENATGSTQAADDTIWFAGHTSPTTVRVFRLPEADLLVGPTSNVFSVAPWSNATRSVPFNSTLGPQDWAGDDDGRILGAYSNASEVGFLWGAAPTGAITQPHVRVLRVRPNLASAIDEHTITWPGGALLYPVATTNAAGHVGLTFTRGSSTRAPAPAVAVVDPLTGWDDVQPEDTMQASYGPPRNAWGPVFSCVRDPENPFHFVATGIIEHLGPLDCPLVTRFGRHAFEITTAGLVVESEPPGAAIACSISDRFGQSSGVANFMRSYPEFTTNVQLLAPVDFTVGGTAYRFDRWRSQTTLDDAAPLIDQPAGVQSHTIGNLGSTPDRAVAVYREVVPGEAVTINASFCPQLIPFGGPRMSIFGNAQYGPFTGEALRFEVDALLSPNAFGGVLLGSQPTTIDLGPLGVNCRLGHDVFHTLPLTRQPSTLGVGEILLPDDPTLIGSVFFATALVADAQNVPANRGLPIAMSLSKRITIGGLR